MGVFAIAKGWIKEKRKPIYMQWVMQATAAYLAAADTFALFASACPGAVVAPVHDSKRISTQILQKTWNSPAIHAGITCGTAAKPCACRLT